ncbi:hypothetical protein D0Z08_09580 [Nocardioides immobilis]|uniref:Amidohydrolase 3 domain-containing protein n=2 Tax=Nocardioides immobilis TaxID=2049295 RepID=A0A417Y421_9ACTN|nr:hypothetical protein D0Z08_09580 [Nocardioides immobilis]
MHLVAKHVRLGVDQRPRPRRPGGSRYDADLVVLDTDPFQDPAAIGAAEVVSTWIGGRAVWPVVE